MWAALQTEGARGGRTSSIGGAGVYVRSDVKRPNILRPSLSGFGRTADGYQFPVDPVQCPGVELQHFAVVGHKAVDLALDVGCLRVDGGGEALFDKRLQPGDQILIAGLERGAVRELAVSPVALVRDPQVLFNRRRQPAELAQ